MTRMSGGLLHVREDLFYGLDRTADPARTELAHAADAEGLQTRELAWIKDVAALLHRIVEALEAIVRAVGRVERHDDGGLNGRGQEALKSQTRHALDEGAAVARVARSARAEAAFFQV